MRPVQLIGSRAEGTLQVAETAMNELLRLNGRGTAPALELLPHNTVVVRYGVLHARAELPRSMSAGPSPRLTLRLASVMVAWALKAAVREPYVHISGRSLTIELSAVPALREWRDLWNYVSRLTFETVPGALRVGFTVAMTAEAGAAAQRSDDAGMV